MATEIFYAPNGDEQERLVLEDDGLTMTLWKFRNDPLPSSTSQTLTVEQARQRNAAKQRSNTASQ